MAITGAYVVPHPPIIIPEIGKGEEIKISKTIEGYKTVAKKISEENPDTIIVITPHSVTYSDYIHISHAEYAEGSFLSFGAPQVKCSAVYDKELVDTIEAICRERNIPAGTLGEKDNQLDHGTLIPLYFINQFVEQYKILRISISGLDFDTHYQFGTAVAEAVGRLNRTAVIVASGDLSHKLKADGPYGFAEEGPAFDQAVCDILKNKDFMQFFRLPGQLWENAAECGLRSFIIMAGALDQKELDAVFLSYEGPFGVGYGICCFEVLGNDENRNFLAQRQKENQLKMKQYREAEDEYIRLARNALENFVLNGTVIKKAENISDDLQNTSKGVFVSLKKNGALRGCIGTIGESDRAVADEIIENAISSGTKDPRFASVSKEELAELVYSVDILGELEMVDSTNDLDVSTYGIVLESGFKRGLLLPNLEGIDTVEKQIAITLQKAGIAPHEAYTIKRFKVVRHQCR